MFAKAVVASVVVVAARAGHLGAPLAAPYAAGYGLAAPAYGHGYAAAAPVYGAAVPAVAKAAVAVAYPPQPYQFGYQSVDAYGTKQARHEVSDAHNNKKGSYSFTDARGVFRRVDYVADKFGFRATVHTNEPGTAPSAPAGVLYNAAPVKTVHAVAAPVAVKATVAAPVVAAAPVAFKGAYAHGPYGYGHHY